MAPGPQLLLLAVLAVRSAVADEFDQAAGLRVMIHQEAAPVGLDAWCAILAVRSSRCRAPAAPRCGRAWSLSAAGAQVLRRLQEPRAGADNQGKAESLGQRRHDPARKHPRNLPLLLPRTFSDRLRGGRQSAEVKQGKDGELQQARAAFGMPGEISFQGNLLGRFGGVLGSFVHLGSFCFR